MARPTISLWKYLSANLWGIKVRDEDQTERTVVDSDGYLYQQGTKITVTAAEINGAEKSFTEPLIADGDDGVTLTSADQTNSAAVVTIPDIGDAADEFVMKDTTQTLTAKTLTSPVLTTPKIADGDVGCTITSADQTNASATITIPNCADAADEFVLKDTAQTLTLKTLTSPVITTPQINDTSANHQYVFAVSELSADRTVTLPLLTGDDEFVFKDHTQTFTNKTLTSPTLTTPKIVTTGAITDAGGDEYLKFVEAATPITYVQITSGNTTVKPIVQGAGETNIGLQLMGSGTGNVTIVDATTPTKALDFELVGATASTMTTITASQTDNRTLTLPDATDTLVGKATTDVLSNKVLTLPQINDTTADHQYVFAVSELEADRTVTLPLLTSADEFVFKDHTQTLTKKTLTAPVITQPQLSFTFGTHDYGAAHSDWTLSAAELLKTVHKPTSADAAVNAVIADAAGILYIFINATGHALTVKTATGSGIEIANAKTGIVMSDGTNVIRISTDA